MVMEQGLRRMGDTLVSTVRVLTCSGACCFALFSASFAAADAVDDLLAGKPVVISSTPGDAPVKSPAQEQTLKQLMDQQTGDEDSLSDGSFTLKLTEPSQVGLEVTGASAEAQPQTATSTATLNLVPEPSAIILAVLSLVYFLIFFRRRYLF